MRKEFLLQVKAGFPKMSGLFLFLFIFAGAQAQQNIINKVDNTRPGISPATEEKAVLGATNATRRGNYATVTWNLIDPNSVRHITIEYRGTDSNYLAAGQPVYPTSEQKFVHFLRDTFDIVYRLNVERSNGTHYYSRDMFVGGITKMPVKIFPTSVTGGILNVTTKQPIERIEVISGSGVQSYAEDVNGQNDYMRVNLPALEKGMYFATFYGAGWKQTERFIIE